MGVDVLAHCQMRAFARFPLFSRTSVKSLALFFGDLLRLNQSPIYEVGGVVKIEPERSSSLSTML